MNNTTHETTSSAAVAFYLLSNPSLSCYSGGSDAIVRHYAVSERDEGRKVHPFFRVYSLNRYHAIYAPLVEHPSQDALDAISDQYGVEKVDVIHFMSTDPDVTIRILKIELNNSEIASNPVVNVFTTVTGNGLTTVVPAEGTTYDGDWRENNAGFKFIRLFTPEDTRCFEQDGVNPIDWMIDQFPEIVNVSQIIKIEAILNSMAGFGVDSGVDDELVGSTGIQRAKKVQFIAELYRSLYDSGDVHDIDFEPVSISGYVGLNALAYLVWKKATVPLLTCPTYTKVEGILRVARRGDIALQKFVNMVASFVDDPVRYTGSKFMLPIDVLAIDFRKKQVRICTDTIAPVVTKYARRNLDDEIMAMKVLGNRNSLYATCVAFDMIAEAARVTSRNADYYAKALDALTDLMRVLVPIVFKYDLDLEIGKFSQLSSVRETLVSLTPKTDGLFAFLESRKGYKA